MSTASVQCPKCKTTLPDSAFNLPDFLPCPGCGSGVAVTVYPAFFRPPESGRTGELVMSEGEASCFYHPQKKATLPCEVCGRFVCALCDCVHDGKHLCPTCLETGRTKGKIKSLENTRTRYDNMIFGLAVLAFVPPIIYISFFTSAAALFLMIRHRKSPLGLTQRSRVKFYVGGIIALLQFLGWLALGTWLIARISNGWK
ncbi:MAG: hypothetical protein EPO07_07580 [Verrucomicrobia bacterium]|nr:MAG: hypothetical protein EPO07_07580 [Verrucomicrobiota bacterium]